MASIIINTDSKLTTNDIQVLIDQQPVEFFCQGQDVVINNIDLYFGFHILEIQALTKNNIRILDGVLDELSMSRLIYTGFSKDNSGKITQPATALHEVGTTWVLPMYYPLTLWTDQTNRKFEFNDFGTDLSEKYYLFYPDSEDLSASEFPQGIKDFYQYNFDFTSVKKDNLDLDQIPYLHYKKPIPQNLLDSVTNEVYNLKDDVKDLRIIPYNYDGKPGGYSHAEEWNTKNNTFDDAWHAIWVFKRNIDDLTTFEVNHLDKFPAIAKLINHLDLDVFCCFVGITPPGAYIYPHIDNSYRDTHKIHQYTGCTQLYIPLVWPDGNSLRFSNVGNLPLKTHAPLVINNYCCTHASVNNSTSWRAVVAFRCNRNIVNDCEL